MDEWQCGQFFITFIDLSDLMIFNCRTSGSTRATRTGPVAAAAAAVAALPTTPTTRATTTTALAAELPTLTRVATSEVCTAF